MTLKDSGGTTVDTQTTGASGVVTLTPPAAGTYTLVVVKTGQAIVTTTVSVTCSNSTTVLMGFIFNFTVTGCNGIALPGAAGDDDGHGGRIRDPPMRAVRSHFPLPCSNRIATRSRADTVQQRDGDDELGVRHLQHLARVDGGDRLPIAFSTMWASACISLPDTLHLTDSEYGAVTLTWNGTRWSGTKVVTIAAPVGCAAVTATLTWTMNTSTPGPAFTTVGGVSWRASSVLANSRGGACIADDAGAGSVWEARWSTSPAETCPPAFSITTTTPGGAWGTRTPMSWSAAR